jgi:hypothetical protein
MDHQTPQFFCHKTAQMRDFLDRFLRHTHDCLPCRAFSRGEPPASERCRGDSPPTDSSRRPAVSFLLRQGGHELFLALLHLSCPPGAEASLSGQPSVAGRASGDHTGSPLQRGDALMHHSHSAAIFLSDDRPSAGRDLLCSPGTQWGNRDDSPTALIVSKLFAINRTCAL